jgi:hypothetical protein
MKSGKLTVVIPIRGEEPWAIKTVENIIETAGAPVDVITVYDGREPHDGMDELCSHIIQTKEPVGTQRARHLGVMAAKTSLIMTCDAHMQFSRDWAAKVSEWYREPGRRKTVSCGAMGGLDEDYTIEGPPNHFGAEFWLKDRNPENMEHYALCAKWGAGMYGQQTGCVMGAFYVLRKKWYEEIGQPWACGTAWGCDEESLCASTWICGGEVRLLPEGVHANHMMRTGCKPGAYQPDLDHWIGIWLNRARLLHCLPMPDAERQDLLDWIGQSKYPMIIPDFGQRVANDIVRPEVKAWRARLARGDWSLLDSRINKTPTTGMLETPSMKFPVDQWETPPTTTTEARPPQVIHRRREVCHLCDALDSFKVYATHDGGNRQYLKCGTCGAHAVRVHHGPLQPGI